VNVIISAFPMPPRNVTEFVPLPAHPAHVNVPLVLNVTGSACAVPAATDKKPATSASIKEVFKKILITCFLRRCIPMPPKPRSLVHTHNRRFGRSFFRSTDQRAYRLIDRLRNLVLIVTKSATNTSCQTGEPGT